VSNLPTWVFAEEKLAFERADPDQPPIPIVAFTLNPKPNAPARAGPKLNAFEKHVFSVARTAISGSQGLSQRFIEDLVVVPLETALEVLDFDASWTQLAAAYEDGRVCANRHIRHALSVKPDRVRDELQRIHIAFKRALNARRRALRGPLIKLPRANLAEPFGAMSFRVTYGYNMAKDADDRLLLDHRGRGVSRAYNGTFVDLVGSFSPDRRETDDNVVLRSRVFVDTLKGALAEAGDILHPMRRGLITPDDIQGELYPAELSGQARRADLAARGGAIQPARAFSLEAMQRSDLK
jgi:hypothetical protein